MQPEKKLEEKIIIAAKELFTKNGFAETSMSDIAAHVGIKRPVLHYYFRTKERMFMAVIGSIVESLIPKVQNIINKRDLSVAERTAMVVDAYYRVFATNPNLPMFIMREINRDFSFVENIALTLGFNNNLNAIKENLQNEMRQGLLKPVPLRILFLSFCSMLTVPFTMRPLCTSRMLNEGESFESLLEEWKPYIIKNITNLLEP